MHRRTRDFYVSRGRLAEHLSEAKILQSANRDVAIYIPNWNHRPYPSTIRSGPSSIRGGSKNTESRCEPPSLELRFSRLEERNSRLEEEKTLLLDSQLGDYGASGRYKLADAVTKNVLRIPGAKAMVRRTRPKQ